MNDSQKARLMQRCEMPLLTAELKDLAWKRKTYIIRFVYAAVLFTVACVLFFGNLSSHSASAADGLGRGRLLFLQFVTIQFWVIVLFLPTTTSGVITVEKERNSLGVLMLTTLSPFKIILQKLLSRLIPMFSFLLLAMPLLAVAYSFGGVTEELLWSGILALFMTCVQIGTLSVMCSTWSRTTPEALVLTYGLFFCLYSMFRQFWLAGVMRSAEAEGSSLLPAVTLLLVNFVVCLFGLLISASMLQQRAFLPAKNFLLLMFRELDAIFTSWNKLTGGVELVKDRQQWPTFRPVAWRETARKSLGTVRYLFRVLVVLEIPVMCVCSWVGTGTGAATSTSRGLLYLLWLISTLLVAAHGASLISSERSRQTLDVLLTTPISSDSLLLQKISGLRRLQGVLLVPFLSIILFEFWTFSSFGYDVSYVVGSLLTLLTLQMLIAWFSIWIGLRVRSQTRAILTSIGILALVAALPVAIRELVAVQYGIRAEGPAEYLLVFSPVDVIRSIETLSPLSYGLPKTPTHVYIAAVTTYAAVAFLFRQLAFSNLDRKLGRVPEWAGRRHRS